MRMVIAFVAMLFVTVTQLAQMDLCVRRTVPVNVVDDRGQLVTGLTENNFMGSIHHQPVRIVSVRPDGTARRVVIVLDASGSMTGEQRIWHLYLAVGRDLITPIPEGTFVGLVVFSSKIEENIPLTTSKKSLQDELARLNPGPNALPKGLRQTALWDALEMAAAEFDKPQQGDAIYAITDGADNASKTSEKPLGEELLNRGIRLFTFSVDRSAGPTPEETNGPASLQELTQATGGYTVRLPRYALGGPPILLNGAGKRTPEGELLMLQFRQIFSFQRIEVQLPKAPNKTQDWNLKIAGMKTKDLTLVYPHKLAGCAIQSQSASSLQ
jgi:Mg-chelatase subunit ChlD